MKLVEPGLRSFVDPATRLRMRMPTFVLHLVAARSDVPTVVATFQAVAEVFGVVRFVGAHVLRTSRFRLGTMDRHAVERWHGQLKIVPVCRSDRQSQYHAASIGQHRTLHPRFAAIGRVWPGFFPHPAVLSSSLRRASASATRCLCGDRIQSALASTACGTRRVRTRFESNDADCCRNRTPAARPSTRSRSASHSKCHQQRVVGPIADDHPWDAAFVSATTCTVVAKEPQATVDRNLQ